MNGYSPKLPLVLDEKDGTYSSNMTMLETIKQNLKMLILTNPGERVMDPEFGVGIRNYLFSQNTDSVAGEISSRIYSQINDYLNFILVEDVIIIPPSDINENLISVTIQYSIPSLNITDTLNMNI